jgi:hypothetical protein
MGHRKGYFWLESTVSFRELDQGSKKTRSIFSLSQFLQMPKLPQKMQHTSKSAREQSFATLI